MRLPFVKKVLLKVGKMFHSFMININRFKGKNQSDSWGFDEMVTNWIVIRA